MTIKTTGIQKRGKKYYLRIRVPEDCQDALGKKEVVKSLGTSDEAEALRKAQDLRAEWNAELEKLRRSSAQIAVQTPTGRHIEAEVRRELIHPNINILLELLLSREDIYRCEQELEFIQESHERLIKHLEKDDLDQSTLENVRFGDVLGAYDQNKWPYTSQLGKIRNSEHDEWKDCESPMDHSVWTLAETLGVQTDRRALRAILRALRDELEYCAKEIIHEFPTLNVQTKWDPLLQGIQTATPAPQAVSPAQASPAGRMVRDVLDECLDAKERATKGREDIEKEVLTLLSWLGKKAEKTPVTDITTAHIIDYRDNYLRHIGKNINKNEDLKGKSLKALVTHSKREKLTPISVATLNNRLKQLNVFFS